MKAKRVKTRDIEFLVPNTGSECMLPFVEFGVAAGFPSPADDYLEEKIDLNRELIKNPNATFLARIRGDSMINEGIYSGNIAVIDRSLPFTHGRPVLAYVDGGFTIKTLSMKEGVMKLEPSNPAYPTIEITADDGTQLWGVVTWVLKQF